MPFGMPLCEIEFIELHFDEVESMEFDEQRYKCKNASN